MSDSSLPLNRRDFAKAAALAAAAPVLAPLAACAGNPPETAPQPAPGPASPASTAASPTAPSAPPQRQNEQESDPQAAELMEVLRVKYRDRLTAEQWEEVRRGIEGNLRAAKAMREFELPISTEPAFVFRAYRGGAR